ncbi:MAG: peptidylprolyl isomerase [Lentisphaerae bacterium]|jgi:peptidylprolyl isomerase|nr:peptidylprolyl isomerase [Lentisphaerota bacterium]
MTATRKARMGDKLLIHYVCRSQGGRVLESTHGAPPPEIVLGGQDILPALEKAFVGLAAGERRHVVLGPSEAFGDYDPELVETVKRTQLRLGSEPMPSMMVEVDQGDGEPMPGRIIEISEDSVLVDCNHPLAGETLEYDLTLVEIKE